MVSNEYPYPLLHYLYLPLPMIPEGLGAEVPRMPRLLQLLIFTSRANCKSHCDELDMEIALNNENPSGYGQVCDLIRYFSALRTEPREQTS